MKTKRLQPNDLTDDGTYRIEFFGELPEAMVEEIADCGIVMWFGEMTSKLGIRSTRTVLTIAKRFGIGNFDIREA